MNITILVAAALMAPADSSDPHEQLAALDWLAGSWKGPMWGGTFHAYYSTPVGGKILSHSELVSDGKVGFHEFERFDVRGGVVHLTPYPRGRPAMGFSLKSVDAKARKAVFENPKKDYPTRITYHRASAKRLVITLDDPHGKSSKREVFDLTRS